jgi:hypothetical protein
MTPFTRRHASVTVRVRGKDGGFVYRNQSLDKTKTKITDIDRKKVNEQIAVYRQKKMELEKAKLQEIEQAKEAKQK